MTWQPIETMPFNKQVLVSDCVLVKPATRVGDGIVCAPSLMRLEVWTHWMPMPEPPKDAE